MLELLQMWALVEIIGLIGLPLTITVFHNLPDRGWAFSKSLSVIVFVFCVWLPLMWLRFLPYTQLFLLGVACILVALSLPGWLKKRREIWKVTRLNLIYVVATEVIFLGMVLLLGWVRSFGPEIRGWEMFMDEGFLSSIMRSTYLPPSDMWYAGNSINYYYYAHFFIATLAKLLGQPSYIAFNTGICLLFGLTGINFFGVTCNMVAWARYLRQRTREKANDVLDAHPSTVYPSLTGSIFFGLLTICMALLMGNLASTQLWWQNHGMVTSTVDQAYNFWVAPSRVINKTINEFPAFSFLLSCFHAHVLAFAFTILAIGVAFNLFLEPAGKGLNVYGEGWRLVLTLFCTALVLGGLFLMNGWDYPTYIGLCLVCIILQQWLAYRMRFEWALLLDIFVAGASLVALSFLLYLPFFLTFVSPAQGIGLVAPADRSPLNNELLIYGIFAFIVLSFLIASAFKRPLVDVAELKDPGARFSLTNPFVTWILVGVLLLLGLLVLLLMQNTATLLIAGGIAIAAFLLALSHLGDRAHAYALMLGALAFVLIAGCEVFFLRDVFADQDPRMNTVFKFYFQAWALLSIASGVGLYFLIENLRPVKVDAAIARWVQLCGAGLWYALLLLLLFSGMIYPLQAPYARYGPGNVPISSKTITSTGSLNGLSYLKNDPTYPGDYEAILWLNEHVQGNPGIIEAVGGDYTEYGRISIFTGLSDPINWPGHEVQWRVTALRNPTNAQDFNQRQTAVDLIYQDPDKNIVLQNMKRYRIEYLYVGPLEYKKYQSVNLHRFAAFMQTVYNANGVTIYKVQS